MFVVLFLAELRLVSSSNETIYPVHPVLRTNSAYNRLISPYDATRQQMEIHINTALVVLLGVYENIQQVSYIASLNYTWVDQRLAFDPKELGINYVVVPANILWLPWINCWSCVALTKFDKLTDSDDALIEPDGRVTTLLRAKFDTVCQSQVEAFPFDVQFCGWNFDGGWADYDRQVLYPEFDKNRTYLIGSAEWYLDYHSVYIGSSFYGFKVLYKLTRNAQFYLCFMILPTFVISSACIAALLLPSSLTSGEKINMGITGLMGLTFLLSIIVQEVPRSQALPLIGKWLLIQMFFCIIGMLLIYPTKKIKLRLPMKGCLLSYGVDILIFLIVFLSNLGISLYMYIYPGSQKEPPVSDVHF